VRMVINISGTLKARSSRSLSQDYLSFTPGRDNDVSSAQHLGPASITHFQVGVFQSGTTSGTSTVLMRLTVLPVARRSQTQHFTFFSQRFQITFIATLFTLAAHLSCISAQVLLNGQTFTNGLSIVDAPAPSRYVRANTWATTRPCADGLPQSISCRQQYHHCDRSQYSFSVARGLPDCFPCIWKLAGWPPTYTLFFCLPDLCSPITVRSPEMANYHLLLLFQVQAFLLVLMSSTFFSYLRKPT